MRALRSRRSVATPLAGLILAGQLLAGDGSGGTAIAPPRGLPPAEAELAAILRRARSADQPDYELLAEQAAGVGTAAVRASLRLLERETVPVLEPEQSEQVLSQPQREVLLAGLSLQDREVVLSALADRLALAYDLPGRLLALRVLGAVGDSSSLDRLATLALRQDEEELPAGLEPAMQEAIARILRRQPDAFDRLHRILRQSPEALQAVWIVGAGDTGNPRALEVCTYALGLRRELAPVATAQVLRVGRSSSADLNRELVERLRWMLDAEQPALCRSVSLALGELRDYASIPILIELLDSGDPGLAQNAGWALQRITGLHFPAVSEPWRDWHGQELAWFRHEERRVLRNLSSRDPAKVAAALREIGRRRTQREDLAVEVLPVLERAEPSLRAQACDTLGLLGAELALPALVERLEADIPYCAQAAWRALGSISGLDLPPEGRAWRDALRQGA